MLTEGNPAVAETAPPAKDRVRSAPPPDWASLCAYDPNLKRDGEAPVTFLLYDTQINAERHEIYVHQVIRLETAQAVQHWSQWRLQFEPKTQLVTLHSLKVRRGATDIDQSNLQRAHFLQREEGLDRFIIHGWFTLLMILEDVRPGDILEFSYTIESQTRLFPNQGGYFFTLPQVSLIGKYRFAVQSRVQRGRRWKSSATAPKPVERRENDTLFWEWSGDNYANPRPEENTPSWHVAHLWIQTSDFPDWKTVAAGVAEAWAAEADTDGVIELARDIEAKETTMSGRIERAIQLVQDECRYLSVSLELGGYIPASPDVVARRRFGDCKDLSFLLVNLLNQLRVPAKPVLVNTALKQSVSDFLPVPSLFNHAVVEFAVDGKRYWVDTTFKEQGGGAFNRFIPDYGAGLPVTADADSLISPPQAERSDLYDLHEHLLLDTKNGPSLMAVTLRVEGNHADQIRFQLKKAGVEEWAKQRLQSMIHRYRNVSRVGSIKYDDDRAANRFTVAEVFEIEFQSGNHPNSKFCRISLPGGWVAGVLTMPHNAERRTPFALPFPCRIHYVTDIDSRGIQRTRLHEPRVEYNNPFVRFVRLEKAGFGYYVMRLALTSKADAVPADAVGIHRSMVEKIARAACRELTLLRGYRRPVSPPGFGELPPRPNGQPPPLENAGAEAISPVIRKQKFSDFVNAYWRALVIFVIFFIYLLAIVLAQSHSH